MPTAQAEIGKARYVKIDQLETGMKVHRDVVGRGNKVLVGAGEILSHKHVKQLQKWETRDKPKGPALPKADPKNRMERVRHGEFAGGWKPSHFNPAGVLVSATLASGIEAPAVETDPALSPVIQGQPRKSHAIPNPDNTMFGIIEAEIRTLESMNAQLGGAIHTLDKELVIYGDMETRRDQLKADNERLIIALKTKENKVESTPARPIHKTASTRRGR